MRKIMIAMVLALCLLPAFGWSAEKGGGTLVWGRGGDSVLDSTRITPGYPSRLNAGPVTLSAMVPGTFFQSVFIRTSTEVSR